MIRVAPLIPLLAFAWGVVSFAHHVNDDAYITFRYSQALATGLGPYFNPGEHVEGYTNFLWMVILAAVHAIAGGAAVPLAAKGLGIAGMGFAIAIAPRLAGHLAGDGERRNARLIGVVAAGCVAVFPGVAVNATSGLETGLFAGLTTGALFMAREEVGAAPPTGTASGWLWAAAGLCRPEGAFVFASWWLARFAAGVRGRRAVADAAPVVVAFLALAIFRFIAYDGEWLPNTWYAKSGGYLGITPLVYIVNGAMSVFLGPLGFAIALVGLGVGALRGFEAWNGARLLPVAVVGIVGAGLPLITGADWMPGWRFAVPYMPALAIAVAVGWSEILRRSVPRGWILPVLGVVLALATFAHLDERRSLQERLDLRAEGYATGHGALADWLRDEVLQPGETVALMDIGIVGYRNPALRILDISGLTDRHIARSPGPFLGKHYDPTYVLEQRPEVIVLALSAPGDSRGPLPQGTTLTPWTTTEERLFLAPDFQRNYVRKDMTKDVRKDGHPALPTEGNAASGLDRLAATLGAARVFVHHYPGQTYLLAAFERIGPP